ncbi:molybdopterin-dependent oxidoreductase [Roseibium sp. MMSF_3247]|uniref:molybdopterin-dependent oxidoreductase n=1 Tax=Roseibium sp. MMSF_3247 TaxID=3046691 RepID=UPI00273E769B|nr:molybdopterin-dependent oxidoreductase [Roseibium sp. MMSF_3247]
MRGRSVTSLLAKVSMGLAVMAFAAVPALLPSPVLAQTAALPASKGEVLLTIDGAISTVTDGSQARLDRAALQNLGLKELKTSNPFTDGVHLYEGVLLAEVLDLVGATGTTLTARALDGYSVDIPMQDVRDYPVLLAMKIDGQVMSVRQKGPLWVIYPVDQYQDLKAESYSARSIWQLTHVTVK